MTSPNAPKFDGPAGPTTPEFEEMWEVQALMGANTWATNWVNAKINEFTQANKDMATHTTRMTSHLQDADQTAAAATKANAPGLTTPTSQSTSV
jgi:hypothetical protein